MGFSASDACTLATMPTFIALLRGINVGGRNMIPMRDLCSLCEAVGWHDVRHYIQSGNIVFRASGKASAMETSLEAAITKQFKLSIPVIVRSARQWQGYADTNPFQAAAAAEPNRVMLALAKSPPPGEAAASLRERARNKERIEQIGDAIWIHFPAGQAKTKLSPAVLDRCAGSSVTARNWSTVQRIEQMLVNG